MKSLVYIIDDEQEICRLLSSELAIYGYETKTFSTGTQALNTIKRDPPVLCIVDLGLPDMDGLTLVKKLLEYPSVGVLVLSGRGSLPDRVLGLELGADDYIAKPFEIRELIARVNSLIRRLQNKSSDEKSENSTRYAKFAQWFYDHDSFTLYSVSNDEIILSSAEARLLSSLLRNPQRIVTREQLLGDQQIPYDRSIDSRMSRLRKKLDSNDQKNATIKTVYGAGYMLTCPVEWTSTLPEFNKPT